MSEGLYETPFVWFGNKKRVARFVWDLLGDTNLYIEPFFGTGAVLFSRPENNLPRHEVVNDKDGYLVNFWRALKHDPDGVAYWAYDILSKHDLSAKHYWLVTEGKERLGDRLAGDVEFYDSKVAGYWVWGACAWFGSDWCSGKGPWFSEDGLFVREVGHEGPGVSIKNPSAYVRRGVLRFMRDNAGDNPFSPPPALVDFLYSLAWRIKNVIIFNDDWHKCVTGGVIAGSKNVGIFLDPPYLMETSDGAYNYYDDETPLNVGEWCLKHTNDYKIVLCGYDGEHDKLLTAGWKKFAWKNNVSYHYGNEKKNDNRFKERIWASPLCNFNNLDFSKYKNIELRYD